MNEEFGEKGYAVVDVEALMFEKNFRLVEQIAFVVVSPKPYRKLLIAEKHYIYQPYDFSQLCIRYNQNPNVVMNAINAYMYITHDNYIHDMPVIHPPWNAVRTRITKILSGRSIKIYAKGAQLERTVLPRGIDIYDLNDFGCPKFPDKIHDPLAECLFFSNYIPELY
jgi:hypothetical protein